MRDIIGIDGDIIEENRIESEGEYSGTFFDYGEDHIGYQTPDGDVTVVTDLSAFGDDLGEHVRASLYDDGLDHVAVPFSHPAETAGTYEFPTATATTRDTVADHLLANTRLAIQGGLGGNPADRFHHLLENDNPLLQRVTEELAAVPGRIDETVVALGHSSGPWGGVVYQKEPLDNILHDEVRNAPAYREADDRSGLEVPDAALGSGDLPAEAVPTTVNGEPVELDDLDDDQEPVRAESLGDGPWDDQIESWEE